MVMKVTPPDANIINAEDVIEHILGKDGLIEQNKMEKCIYYHGFNEHGGLD